MDGTAVGQTYDEAVFRPVSTPPTSTMIVDQIRTLIRRGELRPGDRLPNQREMCRSFGVSPITLREALRVLGASGLVDSRLGAKGGAVVTSPSPEHIGDGLVDLILLSPMAAAQVVDMRVLVELGALALAVERATRADIDALCALVDDGHAAMRGGGYTPEMSAAFHTRLVESAHVPVMATLFPNLHPPVSVSPQPAVVDEPTAARVDNHEHRLLVEAIELRDLPSAVQVMVRHLARAGERSAQH